jgi:hypothetical protein
LGHLPAPHLQAEPFGLLVSNFVEEKNVNDFQKSMAFLLFEMKTAM